MEQNKNIYSHKNKFNKATTNDTSENNDEILDENKISDETLNEILEEISNENQEVNQEELSEETHDENPKELLDTKPSKKHSKKPKKPSDKFSKKTIIILISVIFIALVLAGAAIFYFKIYKKTALPVEQKTTISLTQQLSQFTADKKEIGEIGGVYVDINSKLPTASEITDTLKQNTVTISINPFELFCSDKLDYFEQSNKAIDNLTTYINDLKSVGIKVFLQYDPLLIQDSTKTTNKTIPKLLKDNATQNSNLLYLNTNEVGSTIINTISKKLAGFNIDGVILDTIDKSAITASSMEIKNSGKYVGIALYQNDADIEVLKEINYIDFAMLSINANTKEEINSFGAIAKAKIKELSDLGVKTIVRHSQNKSDPVLLYSLASTYDSLKGTENYTGSIFSYNSMYDADALKALLLLFDNALDLSVANTELVITSPENNFKTDKNVIIIAGTCDNNFPLLMNGKEIAPSDKGLFAVDVSLKQGSNTFEFTHKSKTKSVNIIYDIDVLKSISPTKDITISTGSEMTFSVIARSEANVSGTLGSTKLSFKKTDEKIMDETRVIENYSEFVAVITAPDVKKKTSIGKFSATASFSGVTKSMSGGTVSVENKFAYKPGSSSNGSNKDENGNQGVENPTGYLAVINETFGEIFNDGSAGGNLDLATPLYGFLPKGTKDYIVGEAFYKNVSYYKLNSGIRVYQNECKILQSDEYLGSDISAVSANNTGMYTDITLSGSKGNPYTVKYNVDFFGGKYDCVFNTNSISFDIANITSAPDVSSLNSPLFNGASFVKISNNKFRLTLNLRKSGGFYGYKSYINASGEVVLRLKNPKHTGGGLSGLRVLVDPGHSGDDYNFSPFEPNNRNSSESTLNLKVGLKLRRELENAGASVEMTRTTSSEENDLTTTQMRVLNGDYDFFVSVHHNSSDSSSPSGVMMLYFYPFNQEYSNSVYNSLLSLGLYPNQRGAQNKFQNVRVLRQHSTLGTLAELGYNTNKYDMGIITNDTHQQQFATAIKNGVVDYFR